MSAETFQTADGATLSYSRRGAGPLVVCHPGGPGMDPEAYFAAMDLPGFELLVFAPRGTGASTRPPTLEGYRMAGYVADLESLRLHLGLEALTLYGNSHGGMVTLAYATTHPDHVERFVVTNGPARMDDAYRDAATEAQARFAQTYPDGAERLAAAQAASDRIDAASTDAERDAAYRTLMARYVAQEGPAESAYLDRLCNAPVNWEAVDVMYAEMLDGLDLLENAAAVSAPALIIAGEHDVTVPAASMRLIGDALPNARYVEFANAGHFVEVEAAQPFATTLRAFLSE
jgi:pimeloyl-ACP methyl ester carboxylesterase